MTKRVTLYWSLCLVAATTVLGGRQLAGAAAPQAAGPVDERVAAFVKTELLAKAVPSVSIAVMRDGKMMLERAWGLADIEKNVSASPSTTYPIASVAKQFTAALVLKQVDRGRLTLTDPLSKHFAGLSPEVGAVTIEQLLNHTSGMKRPIVDPDSRFENLSPDSLLKKATGSKLETAPGTTWAYSNAGYTVLGVLVERLYGKPYAAALQEEIAGPLQLTTLAKCAEPKPGEASGYVRTQGAKPVPGPGMHHSQDLGPGGICATAADLVKWTHALHTGRVLSPASYQAMITPRGAAVASGYGFGLRVRRAEWGDAAIVHDGQAPTGYTAEVHWYPQHSLAVAVLSNGYPLVRGTSDVVPRIVLGVPLAAPAPIPPTADRATLVGVYELSPQRTFEVTLENGELYVAPPGDAKQPLIFRSGNSYWLGKTDSTTTLTFIVENGAVRGFEADNNGSVRRLRKIK